MEVAIGSNTPFQREVREWQRIDPNTGALLTGRLEADRWINGPLNAYGKVVDSKNMSTPNGTQMTQRKQLEVLQARTSSGSHLQVVRAHTVQTSSSRWSTTSTTASTTPIKQSITSHIMDNNINRNSSGIDNTNININTSGGSGTSINSIRNSFRSTAASSIHHLTSPSLNTNHLIAKTATSNHPHNITNNSMSTYHDTSLKYNNILENTILPGRSIPSQSSSNGAATTIAPSPITVASTLAGTTTATATTFVTQSKSLHNTLKIPTENYSKYRVGCAGAVNLSQMGIETNERETFYNNSHSGFVRGKSISTEDLATERDEHNFDDDVEPAEWRRVSKIRRSLQFPKSTTIRTTSSRPTDLPENLVSVSKIRQELENGRRLNTVMRNNHVNLEALDNILKSVTETATHSRAEGKSTKKTTYITAESLKEVRGKLRKLSDESLYKDDILVQAENESEVKPDNRGLTDISYKSEEHTMPIVKLDGETRLQNLTNNIMMRNSVKLGQGNNGLEEPRTNNKYKDMMSSDWHWRRKSYGFEKMAPPSETMSSRMETSTDSGIGRSGELTTSWSPTEQTPRGTIITFGDTNAKTNNTATSIVHLNDTHQSQSVQKPMSYATTSSTVDDYEVKRHSIAVDETRYVRDNLRRVFEQKTSVHLNGLYPRDENMSQQSFLDDKESRKQKRVEFCKTEVHFAAESGRVNIVETDGKPPPTNNFRRRRRTSGGSIGTSYMEAINSGLPVTHFGDLEKRTVLDTSDNEIGAEDPLPSPTKQGLPTTPMVTATTLTFEKNGYAYDEEDQFGGVPGDETSLRGILKNKPIKPKPYHLGENIESGDSLWGVRLKPVTTRWHQNLSPTESPTRDEDPTALQTFSQPVHIHENKTIQSVADRVRNAEEMKTDSTNIGFSTKVNLTTAQPTFTWQNKDTIQPQYVSPKTSPCFNNNTKKLLEDLDNTKIRIDMRHFGDTYAAPLGTQRNNELKSTSLIMKTLRSATQFDEAMKKLSFHSTEDQSVDNNYKSAFSSLHTSNAVMKSSSTSSLAHNYSPISYRKNEKSRYASSLDGDSIKPNYFEASEYKPFDSLPQTYKNASSVSSSSTASFTFEKLQSEPVQRHSGGTGLYEKVDNHRLETVVDGQVLTTCGLDQKKPVAAPRLKKLSTANTISHQLTQLRRLYDAADLEDSDDSAKLDEEVNLYLGKLANTEERTSELSGSWSRVKAKRKQKENEQTRTQIHTDNKTNILYEKSINITEKEFKSNSGTKPTDVVHSNVMSIALQSPSVSVAKPVTQPIVVTPITKPRTLSPAAKQIQHSIEIQSTKQDNRKYNLDFNKKSEEKDSLKLVRGARKLREHELSYFGVNVSKTSSMSSNSSTSSLSSFSGHIQSNHQMYNGNSTRQLSANTSNSASPLTKLSSPIVRSIATSDTKWQMTNNKPDLLRHSPNIDNKATKPFEYVRSKISPSNADTKTLLEEVPTKVTSEPIYENLKEVKRTSYSRKSDLERDERILDELTKAADQILSAVKGYADNESKEDFKKSSSKQRTHLDTIVENRSSSKNMQSKGVQVSGGYDDNDVRRHHRLCRLSSASSNESLSRKTPPKSVQSMRSSTRSHQHSSLHNGHNGHSNDDHHSAQSSNRSSRRRITNGGMAMSNCSTATGECKRMQRTSSRDTINSYASSSEDLAGGRNNDVQPRRPRRIKLKEKEKSEKSSASVHSDSKRASMSSNRSTLASIGDRNNSKRQSHQNHHGEGSSTSRSRATSRATSMSSTIDHNNISNNKINRLKVSQAPSSATGSVASTTTTAKTTTTTSAAGITTTTLNNSSAHRNGRSSHHHRHRDTTWK